MNVAKICKKKKEKERYSDWVIGVVSTGICEKCTLLLPEKVWCVNCDNKCWPINCEENSNVWEQIWKHALDVAKIAM